MIADQVAGLVPLAEKFLALGGVHPHAANEKGDLQVPFFQGVEECAIGRFPGEARADGGGGVVDGDGDTRPFRRRCAERKSGCGGYGPAVAEEFTSTHGGNIPRARGRSAPRAAWS